MSYTLRKATRQDAAAIRRLIWQVRINPTGLNWRRFLLAVDAQGTILGCGQVKPHGGNLLELASIAVRPDTRGKGIARAIIQRLLAENSPPLYLTCRAEIAAFYVPFGFRVLTPPEMPAYYLRIWRLASFLQRLSGSDPSMRIMVL